MRRLGLDIGTNSIGWCLIEYDDERESGYAIVQSGARIFSDGRDPQSGTSLAVDRREARSARRRRDRYLGRRSAFLDALVEHGLMPADADEAKLIAERDPYVLRARALDAKLEPYEIGRALFHLNQRRGFKSNRKAERKTKDAEDGKIASGAKALDRAMESTAARTLGEFLAGRISNDEPARVRMGGDNQSYDFYPQRSHVLREFRTIWMRQRRHHPQLLGKAAFKSLYRIVAFQRRLKPQEVGVCTFSGWGIVPTGDPRLPKSHPLFQERRLYEEVNHLEITVPGEPARKLTLNQRDKLIRILKVTKRPSFTALGKEIGLQPGESFNKASETRTHMLGDEIHAAMSGKALFGKAWANVSRDRQQLLVEQLVEEDNPDKLRSYLSDEFGLDADQIEAADKAARALPEGYGRLGATATKAIIEQLKRYTDEAGDVITYNKAVEYGLKLHHSERRDGQDLKQLPYYGQLLTNDIAPAPLARDLNEKRWGKITNPTVHIGLRQLEKLVNAIIKIHGRPDQIVVELARELKLNEKDKEEHNKRIRRDTAAAMKRSEKLTGFNAEGEKVGEPIAADTGANRMLLRMWEELNPANPLDRRCPYCARPISIQMLFDREGGADIDHIIPYSHSLDDSAGNKVVAHRSCNRAKGNQTPYKKWGNDPDRWEIISAQVARLHKSKQWRFGPDAMARVEKDGGFLARQLTDTQYLSRLAGRYLSSLYPTKDDGSVYVIPGRMTAMLRRLWGLNSLLPDHNFVENEHSNAPKNRLDHRHHAIDAAVVAVTTRSLMQQIARISAQSEDRDLDKLLKGFKHPDEWESFRNDLGEKLAAITVSHKPDHGRRGKPAPGRDVTAGKLHDATAYGLTGKFGADGKTHVVVKRVMLTSLEPKDISDPDRIRDDHLRSELYSATSGLTGKSFEQAVKHFAETHPVFGGIRRVRVLGERAGTTTLDVIPIHDKSGRAYKAYKGNANARFQVWRLPDGTWKHRTISMFRAHQRHELDNRPHPAAKKIMDLRQNDLLAIERNGGEREIVRVVKFSGSGQVTLAAHNESGNLKARDVVSNDVDPFKYVAPTAGGLKKMKARQVRIDPLGRIFDPGPR